MRSASVIHLVSSRLLRRALAPGAWLLARVFSPPHRRAGVEERLNEVEQHNHMAKVATCRPLMPDNEDMDTS
jgi:hypothetical protein